LDVLTTYDKVEGAHKMRCGPTLKHPGGGGINVARVLHRLGASCLAVYPAGGVTGERHRQLLHAEKVRSHVVAIAQETRESFSVHELSTGQDFRFVLPGPTLSDAECQACFDYVATHLPKQLLVLSGGLAPGVPTDLYARLSQLAKSRGLRVLIDTHGPALTQALQVGVYAFKPSLREFRELTGLALPDAPSQKAAAQALVHSGQVEVVALSLGEAGAMWVTAQQALIAPSLPVTVRTTIGAGDSFVGGWLWSLLQGHNATQQFRSAMAASAAALLGEGTSLCRADDVHRLMADVQVREI
jgi:6-phosphofructokinase 2